MTTTYEQHDGIATITLDDGKVNAFSIATLRALHRDLDQAESEAAVVVLTGRPGHLSAGFDLGGFTAGVEPLVEMLRLGATLAARLLAFPRPVVVASPGHAIAAGVFPLLAADARIIADGPFRIGLNEVKIGLTLPSFAVELARYRLAPPAFDRCVVTAELLDPRGACAAGFVDRVVAADDLLPAAIEEARRLAALNPTAHAATKLRARGAAIAAVRAAIEQELTVDAMLEAAAAANAADGPVR